ncbi:MAG TPA: M28 family peptidase [Candidatus Krumholzibacteria bacterium]|nr:M28 family peptidase [Candidatus Krumholzibacteria bacterium]
MRRRITTRLWRAGAVAAAAAVFAAGGMVAGGCGASEAPVFSADSAWVHTERQVAFGPRVPGSPARDAAARYLARTLERYGAEVSLQAFAIDDPYRPGPLRLINIMGSFAPDRAKRLMLAAHYDSRPWADQEGDSTLWTTPVPGAVDAAASVGVLLEVARIVGARLPADIGVDIVLFDGEDYGKEGDIEYYLLGSQGFVARAAGYRPAAMILLDMLGGRGTRVREEGFSRQRAPELLDFVFARAASLGLTYFESAEGAPMYDDHVPFLQAGHPAIDLFGYDYAAWHTLGDDLGQVDRDLVAQVGTLIRSVVYDFRYPPR